MKTENKNKPKLKIPKSLFRKIKRNIASRNMMPNPPYD